MGQQMINHRGPEFAKLLENTTAKMKKIFRTEGDVLILTSSGTGAMEAAVVNTLSPGDRVLSVSIGVFGDRFAEIAETFGADVVRLKFEWGKAADPDVVREALAENPGVKTVLVTHNETSTGVTNDMKALSDVFKEFEKTVLVDAISSLGSLELPVDDWGLDVTASASQKGWMVPPGLAMVSVSPRAWQSHAQARMPRFYWDFAKAKSFLEKGQTPWTPAVSQVFAMDVALDMLLKEGVDNIVARHQRMADMTRAGVKELGMTLFAEESHASNTVTAVNVPEGVDGAKLNKIMREEYNIVLGGGQSTMKGKIFRIGHLGWVNENEIKEVFKALKPALEKAKI
jgi:aspartate aminotransferase-like enzyme